MVSAPTLPWFDTARKTDCEVKLISLKSFRPTSRFVYLQTLVFMQGAVSPSLAKLCWGIFQLCSSGLPSDYCCCSCELLFVLEISLLSSFLGLIFAIILPCSTVLFSVQFAFRVQAFDGHATLWPPIIRLFDDIFIPLVQKRAPPLSRPYDRTSEFSQGHAATNVTNVPHCINK